MHLGTYRAVLMSPELVSDAWVNWIADPFVMLPLGIKPRFSNRQELQRYVRFMHAQERAVIGIFQAKTELHVGIIEVFFDRKHFTANIDVLIDMRNYSFAAVADAVLPGLLKHLARRFKIAKFSALIPETHKQALEYYTEADWELEAELMEEIPSQALHRRLNAKQFAWFPPKMV